MDESDHQFSGLSKWTLFQFCLDSRSKLLKTRSLLMSTFSWAGEQCNTKTVLAAEVDLDRTFQVFSDFKGVLGK